MKRTGHFLRSLLFASLLVVVSCGSDNALNNSKGSGSSALTGNTCGCQATYFPVNDGYSNTYDNSCIAACHGVTKTYPGNLICREALRVCARDSYGRNVTVSECEAVRYRYTVTQYAACGSATY